MSKELIQVSKKVLLIQVLALGFAVKALSEMMDDTIHLENLVIYFLEKASSKYDVMSEEEINEGVEASKKITFLNEDKNE